MHTLARTQTSAIADARLHALLSRYRVLIYVALFVFAVALAFAERHADRAATIATVAAPTPSQPVPADADDRPLALPDR